VREESLHPTYRSQSIRGKVRYYSFRDLLIARVIQRLARMGVELKRLKKALRLLRNDASWSVEDIDNVEWLTTDGKRIYFHRPNGTLLDVTTNQHAFAFMLNVRETAEELKK